MICLPRRSRPAIIVDDRLPYIEYEPETLHGADIMVFRGENFTDSDYMPLPGSESKKDTNQ